MAVYFPPAWALTAALATEFNGPDTKRVSISLGLLKTIIRLALRSGTIDQQAYLDANPDLKQAFDDGKIESIVDHWIDTGYFEGRSGATQVFDESWYVGKYRDVGLALETGLISSAAEHFAQTGEREWRAPNAEVEPEIRAWRQALLTQVAPMRQAGSVA